MRQKQIDAILNYVFSRKKALKKLKILTKLHNKSKKSMQLREKEKEGCHRIQAPHQLCCLSPSTTVLSKAALLSCARFTCDIYATYFLLLLNNIEVQK
jgi:uncharacterized membrane protein YbhN (UPF0104 family)